MNFTFLVLFFLSQLTFAKSNSADPKKSASDILQSYSAAKGISAEIEKVDEKLTLGTKQISKGTFKYSAGKIFLAMEADKKTELYFKGSKVTLVDYPDQDFDKNGARKVTHFRDNAPAFLKSMVNLFSNPKTFFKEFEVISAKQTDDLLSLDFKPGMKSLKNFKLNFNTKSKSIDSISFVDDVETATTIKFNRIEKKSIAKSVFEFKALKTDQEVTQ